VAFTGANASSIFSAAVTLPQAVLTSLGAASVVSSAPQESPTSTTTAAPGSSSSASALPLPLGAIIGIAVGGVVLISLIVYMIKRNSGGEEGYIQAQDYRAPGGRDQPGDAPMLVVPNQARPAAGKPPYDDVL